MITTRILNNQTIIYDGNEEIARWNGKQSEIVKEMRDSIADLTNLQWSNQSFWDNKPLCLQRTYKEGLYYPGNFPYK